MSAPNCPSGESVVNNHHHLGRIKTDARDHSIAHRLRDMQRLPWVVVTNPHMKAVYDLYYNAFDTFRKIREVKTLEDNDKMCDIISQNLKSHLTVIPKLAMGILECGGLMDPNDLDKFMNTILRSVRPPGPLPVLTATDHQSSASQDESSLNSTYP